MYEELLLRNGKNGYEYEHVNMYSMGEIKYHCQHKNVFFFLEYV